MEQKPVLPGGQIARRDMHFFWLLDGSTSMAGEKIAALNFAVANAIPDMRDVARSNPQARLLVQALRFADDVEWLVNEPTPIAELTWNTEVKANGETAIAKAISAVIDRLEQLGTHGKFFPPVIILVTDGHPTDSQTSVAEALRRLNTSQVGKVSQRFAVAIGADADKELLRAFIGNDNIPVLEANDERSLAGLIKVVSVAAIESSSKPLSDDPRKKILAAKESSGTDSIYKW